MAHNLVKIFEGKLAIRATGWSMKIEQFVCANQATNRMTTSEAELDGPLIADGTRARRGLAEEWDLLLLWGGCGGCKRLKRSVTKKGIVECRPKG
mmetsp:Transcript_5781/g.8903  ORF Transcript_5781/g.8903 Transcript_5781/m.8903 type:complete len:95 (+) Transcript_5781:95-379(+)